MRNVTQQTFHNQPCVIPFRPSSTMPLFMLPYLKRPHSPQSSEEAQLLMARTDDNPSPSPTPERRGPLTMERKEDMEMIAALMSKEIAALLQSRFTIPSEQHHSHHTFLEDVKPWLEIQMRRERAMCNLCEEMTKKLVKGGIWGLLLYVGYRILTGHWPAPEEFLK